MLSLVILAGALLAQTAPDSQNLQPYLLRLKGESEFRHVLADPNTIDGISFDVRIDEPWLGEEWMQVQRIEVEELEPEDSSPRRYWIDNGWKAKGGEQVTTRSGETIWVLGEEKQWADKAQALLRGVRSSGETTVEAVPIPETSSRGGPGFFQLWAPHAAVLAGTIALGAGVYLALLRPRAQWSALDSGNRGPRRR